MEYFAAEGNQVGIKSYDGSGNVTEYRLPQDVDKKLTDVRYTNGPRGNFFDDYV
jgi:hypothetical protein